MTTFTFDELTLECDSRAGDETWLLVHPPGLAIDVGRGSRKLAGASPLFLTHGHLDHALGSAFLLSLRGERAGSSLPIYCPSPITPAFAAMLDAAGQLDGERFGYSLHPVEPGDRVEVGPGLTIEVFATEHVVPSVGYHLVRRRTRLRSGLEGLDGEEIARRRQAGETVDESHEHRWLSVTGDTGAGVFETAPEVFDSHVLMTECTFLDPGHRERARRFGHLHLDDLIERRADFSNRYLVLGHLSARHRPADLRAAVRERLEPLIPEVLIVGEDDREVSSAAC